MYLVLKFESRKTKKKIFNNEKNLFRTEKFIMSEYSNNDRAFLYFEVKNLSHKSVKKVASVD